MLFRGVRIVNSTDPQQKTRRTYFMTNGLTVDVDTFTHPIHVVGKALTKVTFPSAEAAMAFDAKKMLGLEKEVTDVVSWKNKNIARIGMHATELTSGTGAGAGQGARAGST